MELKDRIKLFFFDRAPNSLTIEHISSAFRQTQGSEIKKALDELVDEEYLEVIHYQTNARAPHLVRIGYKLRNDLLTDYPIATTIEIGSITIPRMIDGDVARAEDINAAGMAFNQIVDVKLAELKTSFENETKKFWGTLVTIFAAFVTLFSLINFAVKPLYFSTDLNLTTCELFKQTTANILPLGGILFLFALILWRVLR